MAAGLALIPLALGGGTSGSEIQTPMAYRHFVRIDYLNAVQHVCRTDVGLGIGTKPQPTERISWGQTLELRRVHRGAPEPLRTTD
jgi:hypothetical protein